jgi:hypothetical protein
MSRDAITADPLFAPVGRFFKPVRAYLEGLEHGPDGTDPVLCPLDGLLAALVLGEATEPCNAVDLAADATAGASTLLCLAHPAVRRVLIRRPGETARRWRFALAQHLPGRAALAELSEVGDPVAEALAEAGTPLVVLAPAAGAAAPAEVRRWLGRAPRTVVLLTGLEETGRGVVEAWAAAFGPASPGRFVALRELAPALVLSRLGVVAARDNRAAAAALAAVGAAFARFGYLDLVRDACDGAIDKAAAEQAGGAVLAAADICARHLPSDEAIRTLRCALERRQEELRALRQRIRDIGKGFSFRFLARAGRLLDVVAPEGTRRRRWIDGLFGTLRRLRRGRPGARPPRSGS